MRRGLYNEERRFVHEPGLPDCGSVIGVARCRSDQSGARAAASACGSSSDEGDSGGSGKEGGEITISQTSQPDYLDPALSYTVNGWEPMWIVYTPLLTYPHVEGTKGGEVIPGLAQDLPKVSNGGKTYELKLRKGLKYSDGQPVVASDFTHTIKRVLISNSAVHLLREHRRCRRIHQER